MYSSASLKFNLLQSHRNVKNLVFLCYIHVCMCSVILVPSLQNSMHPVMKCAHWSFFFAPVSITPLFPSSHSVSMSLPLSSHTLTFISVSSSLLSVSDSFSESFIFSVLLSSPFLSFLTRVQKPSITSKCLSAFLSPDHRPELALLLEVERLWGLPPLLLRLHRRVCSHHPAAAGLCGVCGDFGFAGRDVRGHAGRPAAAAEFP